MTYTPNAVVLEGFPFGTFTFSYLLSGVTATDDDAYATVGKAVAQDTAAAGTMKLAGDGDAIVGRVYQAENRVLDGLVVGSIARKFKERLPAASGHGISVGDRIVGAGAGLVKAAVDNTDHTQPLVVATGDEFVIAEYL